VETKVVALFQKRKSGEGAPHLVGIPTTDPAANLELSFSYVAGLFGQCLLHVRSPGQTTGTCSNSGMVLLIQRQSLRADFPDRASQTFRFPGVTWG
jgi:hypothetical protein